MAETLFRQWFVEEAGEDWGEVTFDDVLTISSSKRIFYKEYVDFGIPFYRSKEIIELSKGGTTSTELFISEERFNEIDSKFGSPKEGDILLTSVGTLGVSYQVRKADKFYFKDGNLTWFKDFKLLPSSIVYCWLNSSIGKEELDNISIGSTQAALTISGLKGIDLKIPSPEIIKKVDDELNTIYETFFFNQTQIRTLQSLRDTLLPKLMSGEVRVQYDKEAIHD
jgi:type I restriction enzyme S subunit